MYLGAIPTQLAPVASAAVPVQDNCPVAGASQAYQEAMAIAAFDGSIYFLGLVDTNGAFSPRLLTQDACAAAALTPLAGTDSPENFLAPCVAQASSRKRAVCVGDSNHLGVVTLLPGNLRLSPITSSPGTVTVRMDWEGIVYDGSSASGTIDAADATVFSNPGANYNGTVAVNDILRLATGMPGKLSEACTQTLQDMNTTCLLERTVTAISADGTQLTLDKPLPRSCFADPDALNYTVRAGGAYLTGIISTGVWSAGYPVRVGLGQGFGMGSPQGSDTYMAFTVQNLPRDTEKNGCDLYGDMGALNSTKQSQYLKRDKPLDFSVADPYTLAQWGRVPDAAQTGTTAAGRVPGGMVMAPAPFSALLVSYSGSGGVYVMRPTAPTNAGLVNNIGYVRILN